MPEQKLSKAEERNLEEKILQVERPSLLDLLNTKNNSANRKTILHRAIIVGKLRNFPEKVKLGEYYDRVFRNQQKQDQAQKNPNPFSEKVTGILIIYPTLFFHVIESSMNTINQILQELQTMHADQEGMISESKILNVSHEINVRLFPVYTFKMVNFVMEHDSSEPTETLDSIVNEQIVRVLRMGKFLNDNFKNQFKKDLIDNLHEQHPEFLPNQNMINFLLKSSVLLTPEEFTNYYVKPFNITLESEMTWPAPVKLFPYH